MDKQRKEKRDRLVTLAFVSILLVLIYGPLASWFVAADRFMYDRLAGLVGAEALSGMVIISINPGSSSNDQLLAEYGRLIQKARAASARRIILTAPPAIAGDEPLPVWAAAMAAGVPIYVPDNHPFADMATRTGVQKITPDDDGILRHHILWYLQDGVYTPSLPLAIALDDASFSNDQRLSPGGDALYVSQLPEIARVTPESLLQGQVAKQQLAGKTVFIDSDPALAGAVATLPSGQFATRSELVAVLLDNLEQRQAIVAPSWIRALEWLAPVLLAILAVLFLPSRKRQNILLIGLLTIATLIIIETVLLLVFRLKLDLGRPMVLLLGTAFLAWWLAGEVRKAAANAYRKGSDFLAAGRLEPAFVEFRRCEPTDSVATAMYKLSLAFEDQAKPERAEAVLNWMKQTQGSKPVATNKLSMLGKSGTPQRLGRYVIERKIGRGAMGAVYLARDPRINRPVALKVIPIEKEFEDEELEEARLRFFREAESAGRLTHPHIITVFDAGEDKHLAYIAMEFLPGIQLTHFTDPTKLLAPSRALELCARTADALDYAHNQGVIHRDIKPANLLYNPQEDLLKISDFGVARMTDNNRTKTGIVLGTPMYMSPEQLGAEELTGHSDLFSLGVTLFELLTGEVPFSASNIAVLMTKITSEDPAPVSNRRAGVPPSVDAVLAKAMAKKPENRFTNGGEMAAALRNCARYASP